LIRLQLNFGVSQQQLSMNPNTAIVPILHTTSDNRVVGLLGTGFLVGNTTLVTAKHVLVGVELAAGDTMGFAHQAPDGTTGFYGFSTFLSSRRFDIACVPNLDVPGSRSLPICLSEVSMTADILAYEFSSSTGRLNQDGSQRFDLTPYSHKGNAMRHYISDFPEPHPTPCFDTSFPALQGASGAPVVLADRFAVVGMLVANTERHLIPAQIARVVVDAVTTEEIRYFLPLGRAIEGKLIAAFLAKRNIAFEAVEFTAPAG
jgi:hypothetical protein